jgi:hypothetical protein
MEFPPSSGGKGSAFAAAVSSAGFGIGFGAASCSEFPFKPSSGGSEELAEGALGAGAAAEFPLWSCFVSVFVAEFSDGTVAIAGGAGADVLPISSRKFQASGHFPIQTFPATMPMPKHPSMITPINNTVRDFVDRGGSTGA